MEQNKKRSAKSWLALIFLGLLWGSSYIFIKKGLDSFSATQVATIRIVTTGLAFLPIAIYHFRKISKQYLPYIAVVGFIGSFFPAFFFAFGQTNVSSAMAGILSSLTPLFTLVIGVFFFRQSGGLRKLVGVILGLIGATWLIVYGNGAVSGDWRYGLFIIAATACYATSSNIVHTKLKKLNPIALGAISFVIISVPAAIILAQSNFIEILQTTPSSWNSLYYLLFLSIFGTFIATMVFFNLVQKEGAVFATMVGYFFPLVATFLGYLDGETIKYPHFIGMALILSGVYILRRVD